MSIGPHFITKNKDSRIIGSSEFIYYEIYKIQSGTRTPRRKITTKKTPCKKFLSSHSITNRFNILYC